MKGIRLQLIVEVYKNNNMFISMLPPGNKTEQKFVYTQLFLISFIIIKVSFEFNQKRFIHFPFFLGREKFLQLVLVLSNRQKIKFRKLQNNYIPSPMNACPFVTEELPHRPLPPPPLTKKTNHPPPHHQKKLEPNKTVKFGSLQASD